jgi:tRNA (uracil-5-)-methyltransferase
MITAPSKIRNKNEFTFGYRYLFGTNGGCSDQISEADFTKVPSVGFMVTGWAGGVSRPHCCENIPREACMVVDIVDDFLQTSPLPPYDSKFHKGFWRTLTIRTSRRTKECMVIIVHSPASGGVGDADGYAEHFEKEKERLVALLKGAELQTEVAELQPLKVTSIFYQEFEGLSNPKPDHPVQHVYGKQFLHERLGKCIFQISPGAFFQVNTEGAEILYQLVVDQIREVSQNPKDTTLLDVCCGTGTIGLTCVTEGVVAEVVGVDISEPAINDARKNAELNGCGQYDKDTGGLIHFVAGRAEQIMTSVMSDAKQSGKKLVAVVDPARDGLHADVVRALRANERIKRIVYVSCNPTGTLVRDAALFCAPPTKRYNASAFRVVAASPVDMFPGTAHTEVVMTFDRLSDKDAYGQ